MPLPFRIPGLKVPILLLNLCFTTPSCTTDLLVSFLCCLQLSDIQACVEDLESRMDCLEKSVVGSFSGESGSEDEDQVPEQDDLSPQVRIIHLKLHMDCLEKVASLVKVVVKMGRKSWHQMISYQMNYF